MIRRASASESQHYLRYRITNAATEELNGKIQAIKGTARNEGTTGRGSYSSAAAWTCDLRPATCDLRPATCDL